MRPTRAKNPPPDARQAISPHFAPPAQAGQSALIKPASEKANLHSGKLTWAQATTAGTAGEKATIAAAFFYRSRFLLCRRDCCACTLVNGPRSRRMTSSGTSSNCNRAAAHGHGRTSPCEIAAGGNLSRQSLMPRRFVSQRTGGETFCPDERSRPIRETILPASNARNACLSHSPSRETACRASTRRPRRAAMPRRRQAGRTPSRRPAVPCRRRASPSLPRCSG